MMWISHATRGALGGAALVAFVGCGGPGLPPAGPEPGEVDVGYGTQPAKDVTGAVSSVSGEHLADISPVRLEELLRGRVAGLQIIQGADGRSVFRIRGTGSLQNNLEPLIVVDGVYMSRANLSSALAGLTRDDIRQVDVLKDVSATSIYGMRGAGGVILISTRR